MKRPIILSKSPRLWAPALGLLTALGSSCSDDDGQAFPAGGAAGAMAGSGVGGATGGNLPAGGSGGASGATNGGTAIGGASNSVGGGGGGTAGSGGVSGRAGDSTAGVTADAGLGGADASGGNIQRCEFDGACLEFRDHAPAPACQESNALNCMNVFAGMYSEGPCPPEYEFQEVEDTFCGPTATFALPSQP